MSANSFNTSLLDYAIALDDDRDFLMFLSQQLNSFGIESSISDSVEEFMGMTRRKPDLIFLDIVMSDHDGVQVLSRLAKENVEAMVVLVSGSSSSVIEATASYARLLGINLIGTLRKPFWREELAGIIDSARTEHDKNQNEKNLLKPSQVIELLDQRLIRVVYQPKVDYHWRRVLGFEALVRLCSPDGELINPKQFLSVIERNQLVQLLTKLVLNEALKDMAEWKRIGLDINVAINIAIDVLELDQLPDEIREAAAKYKISPSNLTFEITERSVAEDMLGILKVATRLRILGCGLSLDDYGSGFSTEERLRHLPFSEIKIDGELVRRASEDPQAKKRISTAVLLGRSLHTNVIAEGVENKMLLDLVSELGCQQMQGFYISRPIEAGLVPEWIRHWTGATKQSAAHG